MKKIAIVAMTIIMCFTAMSAFASEECSPFSSTRFSRCSVTLSGAGYANFSATLKLRCSSVSVQSCTLQKLNGRTWKYDQSLPCPEGTVGLISFNAGYDYSSYLTSGETYRIVAVFNADGETLSTTSGQITY